MRAGGLRVGELVPNSGGLIAHVPASLDPAARTPLLGARCFFFSAANGRRLKRSRQSRIWFSAHFRPLSCVPAERASLRRVGSDARIVWHGSTTLRSNPIPCAELSGTHTSVPEIPCRCRRAAPKRHRAEKACAPARYHVEFFATATTAARASSRARKPRAELDALGASSSAEMVHRVGGQLSVGQIFAWATPDALGEGSRAATRVRRIRCRRICISWPWISDGKF